MADPIGFIGLGAMGRGMALALLSAGHDLVVHNRTREKEEPLVSAGAVAAGSFFEVADRCDVVLSCLPRTAADAVHAADGGLAHRARPGQVLVEHGTIAPDVARLAAVAAAARGARFIDAPVTGGPAAAAAASLTVMAGGDEQALDRVRPLLAAYARLTVHVGQSGAGAELKLVNQMLVACHVAAAADALALLRVLDLPLRSAGDVLLSGWAASAMLDRAIERASIGDFAGDGATISGLAAVTPLVAELVAARGLDLDMLGPAAELLARARQAGLGDDDISGLVNAYDNTTNRSD